MLYISSLKNIIQILGFLQIQIVKSKDFKTGLFRTIEI